MKVRGRGVGGSSQGSKPGALIYSQCGPWKCVAPAAPKAFQEKHTLQWMPAHWPPALSLPRPRSNLSPVGPLALRLRDRDQVREEGISLPDPPCLRHFPFSRPSSRVLCQASRPVGPSLPAGVRGQALLGALQGMFPSGQSSVKNNNKCGQTAPQLF